MLFVELWLFDLIVANVMQNLNMDTIHKSIKMDLNITAENYPPAVVNVHEMQFCFCMPQHFQKYRLKLHFSSF